MVDFWGLPPKESKPFLVIPEGKKGMGWGQLKNGISSMLLVPSSMKIEKEKQCRVESIKYKNVGP